MLVSEWQNYVEVVGSRKYTDLAAPSLLALCYFWLCSTQAIDKVVFSFI